jgi:hypothetical protein
LSCIVCEFGEENIDTEGILISGFVDFSLEVVNEVLKDRKLDDNQFINGAA